MDIMGYSPTVLGQPTEKEEIDKIVKKALRKKDRVKVTYDENGNRYVYLDGEWIG